MEKSHKIPNLVIAIAGASSSGKTMLLNNLLNLLDRERTTHIDMDGYHLYTRVEREMLNKYPEELSCNNFDQIVQHIQALKGGIPINMPVYLHESGSFGKPVLRYPHNVIFVEGLHACMLNEIARQDLIDYSIFIQPSDDLRKAWKVRRDVTERMYLYREALEQIARREYFVDKYISPQAAKSDVLFLIERVPQEYYLKHRILVTCNLQEHLFQIFSSLHVKSCFQITKQFYNERPFLEVVAHCKCSTLLPILRLSPISELVRYPQEVCVVEKPYSYKNAIQSLVILILLLYREKTIKNI